MTNKEAIEFLKNMIDREAIGFVCPKSEGDVAIWQYHIEALQMAISALQAQDIPDTNVGDMISRQAAIKALDKHLRMTNIPESYPGFISALTEWLNELPPAQPDIKQAAKLLSDFIESCPGGDSYLITPDGEKLRTDWGYAMEGMQLIHDWAERRTDD